MDLTVAICTYQRPGPLRETLDSLAACDPIEAAWEVLVIDNDADEAIQQLTQPYANRLPIRYVPEPTVGTSHARNRAVREASAPIILFTDDDVTFAPSWLAKMLAAIHAQPRCAFWGGRVEPVWDTPAPKWFDMHRSTIMGDCVVRYQRGEQPRPWDADEDPPFYTANLAMRVDAVAKAGYFDTTVGHRGGVRVGMEDSLMVQAIASAGGEGWYAADAVVYHPVPPNRMTRRFARHFAWRQGWLSTRIHSHSERVPRWLYRVAATEIIRGIDRWLKGRLTLNPAERFAGELSVWFNLSKLWHAFKGSRSG